ncbi:unnamed protein product [Prorocentrum cordatum]|uniref:CMP/dCMP-type deaminase domain-containing protein n=1 Tax=Prorocentrum cordatum TaxID=2364126 RepID=A0ABN9VCK5_9DINO|nr:unnamed protein product [Polarella glacialis]
MLHAEVMLVSRCAREGVATEGSHLYCLQPPCWECAKSLLMAGVSRICYQDEAPSGLAPPPNVERQVRIAAETGAEWLRVPQSGVRHFEPIQAGAATSLQQLPAAVALPGTWLDLKIISGKMAYNLDVQGPWGLFSLVEGAACDANDQQLVLQARGKIADAAARCEEGDGSNVYLTQWSQAPSSAIIIADAPTALLPSLMSKRVITEFCMLQVRDPILSAGGTAGSSPPGHLSRAGPPRYGAWSLAPHSAPIWTEASLDTRVELLGQLCQEGELAIVSKIRWLVGHAAGVRINGEVAESHEALHGEALEVGSDWPSISVRNDLLEECKFLVVFICMSLFPFAVFSDALAPLPSTVAAQPKPVAWKPLAPAEPAEPAAEAAKAAEAAEDKELAPEPTEGALAEEGRAGQAQRERCGKVIPGHWAERKRGGHSDPRVQSQA